MFGGRNRKPQEISRGLTLEALRPLEAPGNEEQGDGEIIRSSLGASGGGLRGLQGS